jgi:hypothetical protein
VRLLPNRGSRSALLHFARLSGQRLNCCAVGLFDLLRSERQLLIRKIKVSASDFGKSRSKLFHGLYTPRDSDLKYHGKKMGETDIPLLITSLRTLSENSVSSFHRADALSGCDRIRTCELRNWVFDARSVLSSVAILRCLCRKPWLFGAFCNCIL